MAANDDPNQTSPKVRAIDKVGGLGGVGLAVVAFILSGVTPDLFPWLGPWAVLITAALVYGGSRLAAWNATDPLRLNTLTQARAIAASMVQRNEQPDGRHEAKPDPAVLDWPDNRG